MHPRVRITERHSAPAELVVISAPGPLELHACDKTGDLLIIDRRTRPDRWGCPGWGRFDDGHSCGVNTSGYGARALRAGVMPLAAPVDRDDGARRLSESSGEQALHHICTTNGAH